MTDRNQRQHKNLRQLTKDYGTIPQSKKKTIHILKNI